MFGCSYCTGAAGKGSISCAQFDTIGPMKKPLLGALVLMSSAAFAASSVYDFTLDSLTGTPTPIASFKGKVMLMVNVASRCGYTPQYEALQAVYAKYKDQGFVITGFPANNFGGQE